MADPSLDINMFYLVLINFISVIMQSQSGASQLDELFPFTIVINFLKFYCSDCAVNLHVPPSLSKST